MLRIQFTIVILIMGLASCKPTDFESVRRADQEAVAQHSQLAKYLYVQVIKSRNSRDDVRLRALEGLVEVTTTQTFEYLDATKAIDLAIQEFGQDPQYASRVNALRKRGASIYRNNLQNYSKALALIEPLLGLSDADIDLLNEAGMIELSLRMFDEAEGHFKRAWDLSLKRKSCSDLRKIQLNLIQRFVLERKCEGAYVWMDQKFIDGCEPEIFSVESERARCLEMNNEPVKALKIYEDLVEKYPANSKAHFLLDGLKRRIREKQLK